VALRARGLAPDDGRTDRRAVPGHGSEDDGRRPLRTHGEAGRVQRAPVEIPGADSLTQPSACHPEPRIASNGRLTYTAAESSCAAIEERRISAARTHYRNEAAGILRELDEGKNGNQLLPMAYVVGAKKGSE